MLVSGLQNNALFKMTTNCPDAQAHEALRKCAQEMLDKYREKQEQEQSQKLGIKAHATKILLSELCRVPEDPEATREAIASALTSHVEALQGHEHLLSKKSSTYALIEQTRGLRDRHGDARASLLRYHDLKDKLLGPDTPLGTELKAAMFSLAQSKALTLQTLIALDDQYCSKGTGRLAYVYKDRSFPVQGFLNSRLLDSIECCICQNIVNQPREICQGCHLICLECSTQLRANETTTCPKCKRTLLAKFQQNISMERLIGNLQVRCCNTDCGSIIEISEIKSHLALCDEEEIECPGKCTDEDTAEVMHMPRKWLADHAKECPGHFKCSKCTNYFPHNTEPEHLKKYRTHLIARHSTAKNKLNGFQVSLIDKFLSQQEQAQKEAVPQAALTEFQPPLIGWDRDGTYRFAGTDCVRAPQEGVYQSKANPRHFFVTIERPLSCTRFMHKVTLPFQTYSEEFEKNHNHKLKVAFTTHPVNQSYEEFYWDVDVYEEHGYKEYVNIFNCKGNSNSQQLDQKQSIIPSTREAQKYVPFIKTTPCEGDLYLFKIVI